MIRVNAYALQGIEAVPVTVECDLLRRLRRRGDAQQPPQHRQGGERSQRPRDGKDHRSPNAV
jgi:hypothetical protein